MRKWKTIAAPDDPTAWFDVSGMRPTSLGPYKVAEFYDSGTNKTATGENTTGAGSGISAWCFNALSGQRCYVIGAKIWEYASGSLTDRTNGLTVAGGYMCQYGNISVLARGTSNALATSSGGDFSALAGAPSAKIVVVQSNALVAFNTSTSADGWTASDVGDYTNWTTGESASGRILEGNGPITAAVAFGTDILVFKTDSIFRMTYVGGTVKWQIQKVVVGIGCVDLLSSTQLASPVVACGNVVVFLGQIGSGGTASEQYFMFDGVSQPVAINQETPLRVATASFIALTVRGVPMFDDNSRTVCIIAQESTYGLQPYFYNIESDAWGRAGLITGGSAGRLKLPVRGEQSAVNAHFSISGPLRPVFEAGTDKFVLWAPVSPGGATTCSGYVQTSKFGQAPDKTTTFGRLIPLLRARSSNSAGTPAVALTFNLYNERHRTYSNSGSGALLAAPTTTRAVTESTIRNRFDLLGGAATNCYADFKITFTDMDAEIEDVEVRSTPGGEV